MSRKNKTKTKQGAHRSLVILVIYVKQTCLSTFVFFCHCWKTYTEVAEPIFVVPVNIVTAWPRPLRFRGDMVRESHMARNLGVLFRQAFLVGFTKSALINPRRAGEGCLDTSSGFFLHMSEKRFVASWNIQYVFIGAFHNLYASWNCMLGHQVTLNDRTSEKKREVAIARFFVRLLLNNKICYAVNTYRICISYFHISHRSVHMSQILISFSLSWPVTLSVSSRSTKLHLARH